MDEIQAVQKFIDVTGESKESAHAYLEAANWNVETALSLLYSEEEGKKDDGRSKSPDASTKTSHHTKQSSLDTPVSTSHNSRIGTLSQISKSTADDSKNTYFAGGKNSGVAIQGPDNDNSSNSSLGVVDEILFQAQANGPRPPRLFENSGSSENDDFEEEEEDEIDSNHKKLSFFTGEGHRLGSETVPSQVITPLSTSPKSSGGSPTKLKKAIRTLTFWKDGFSIEDGPLHKYDLPENQAILNAIKSGRAPVSVLNVGHGQAVDLRVAQKMDQVYVQPAPKPFSGTGNRLGNVVTPMVHSSPSSSLPSSIPVSFEIDDQQPITTLQIRLADGTRLLAKFNHTHTLRDVRSFVTHSRPDSRRFILQTTFPVKTLDDDNSNLKDSGLLNCTLVQKYI